MTIKINQCPHGEWYRDRIGQVFTVSRHEISRHSSQGIPEDVYWVREGGTYNALNYVRASDAVVMDEDHCLANPMANQEAAMRAPLVVTDDLVKQCAGAINFLDRVTPHPLTAEDQARAVLEYLANVQAEPRCSKT